MITFRQYLLQEAGINNEVKSKIAEFLGVPFEKARGVGPDLEDDVLQRGKGEGRHVIDTAAGKIIISKYLMGKDVFVRVEEPAGKHKTYQK